MVLTDADTGASLALLDAAYLTEVRTAAASAVATRALAHADASDLALVGAGVQARSHLAAMIEVRPIRRVSVIARSRQSAERFVTEEAQRRPSLELTVARSYREAISRADIVCTVSSASEPVTSPEWLRPGAHVNGVGSHSPEARELDGETMRVGRVLVDSREAALAECGDCLIPISEGRFGPEHVSEEIGELLSGARPARTGADQVTVYQSCGVAVQDVAAARAALVAARDADLGIEVDL